MGANLAFNDTYLVSTATYYCKLSFKTIPTGTDHGDICLAGAWLHKKRFLCNSSIVTCGEHNYTTKADKYLSFTVTNALR